MQDMDNFFNGSLTDVVNIKKKIHKKDNSK